MIDDFQQLVRKVNKLKQQRDEAAGAVKEIKKRLMDEFAVASIVEATALLKKLKRQEERAAVIYSKKKKRFENKWAQELSTI